ncbi:transporter substrate-binding domain-containing protein [Pigmentibacter sp. JX0631]|uniref:substrate-binding periplasmic protein n=1 Tax=Pigmentibacter sp. JX0631 TaxID=2976982 RepID=UPI0024684288|nr:transporter substrate-binding domain-containing protein [Pigmentibacter sp. JX0631]WGL59877.1 transporter substrate-binding domain-containing protein [Pigmentibacter sp. JX0631]
MTTFKKYFLTSIIALSTIPFTVFAEDVTIFTHDFPSKTEKWGENQIGGIAGEIISQAFRHKNITFKIIWEPWIRAQEDCLANTDSKSFIIPFTRNADREKKYLWVSKIYNADTVFISYKGTKPINSIEDVKNKKIGVMLATSYETFLLNQKLNKQNIIPAPKDSQNIKALEEKTIDAWYTSVIGALSFLKEQKLNIDYYTFGNKIDTEENYIATTQKTPEKLIHKVKQAIESFKKTPQYAAVVRKYTGKNP